jgi:hypothetical protein
MWSERLAISQGPLKDIPECCGIVCPQRMSLGVLRARFLAAVSVATLAVGSPLAEAQQLKFDSADGREGVTFGGKLISAFSVEAGLVTVKSNEELPSGTENSDKVVTFSLADVTIEATTDTGWPDGSRFLQFKCKPGRKCFHMVYQCHSRGRPIICGDSKIWETDEEDINFGYGQKFPCRLSECDSVVAALKSAAAALAKGPGRTKPSVDCNALRATYGKSGERPVLPAECLTELERETTHKPVAPPPPGPSRPAAAEPVIDGSKIPSRIDFPASGGTRPLVVPTGPTPVPAAASPMPKQTSPSQAQTRKIEELFSQPLRFRPDRAGSISANPFGAFPPAWRDPAVKAIGDIDQAQNPANSPFLTRVVSYPARLIELVMDRIEEIWGDLLR